MANLMIAESDFTALLNLRDTLDKSIQDAQSPYMKSVLTELRAEVARRVVQAQGAKERAIVATHRKTVKTMRQAARNGSNGATA